MEQLLITLENGEQLLIQSHEGKTFRVISRERPGAMWGTPLPEVNTKETGTVHVPGTIYVGEY